MRATAGAPSFTFSNVVDVYNGTTGAWSTAQLSVARGGLAAASVGNVALFAGGAAGSALLCREGGEGEEGGWVVFLWLLACRVFARADVLRLRLPCGRFISHACDCRHFGFFWF
jgi:hypothetical protein